MAPPHPTFGRPLPKGERRALSFLFASILLGARAVFAEPVVVHHTRSAFAEIFVVDDGGLRFLRFDNPHGVNQTGLDRRDPAAIVLPYLRAVALGPFLADSPKRALMIGLGGGAFTRFLRQQFPEVVTDAVEIDPEVVKVAKGFFDVEEGPNLAIHVADGGDHLERLHASGTRGTYDVVFLDAYGGSTPPAHLVTVEFFERTREQLSAAGVAIANVALVGAEERESIAGRFARAFPEGCLRVHSPESRNVVLVGARRALPGPDDLVRRALAIDRMGKLRFPLEPVARTREPCVKERS